MTFGVFAGVAITLMMIALVVILIFPNLGMIFGVVAGAIAILMMIALLVILILEGGEDG